MPGFFQQSHRLVVPSSRSPVVPWSRSPVVPSSRSLAVSQSRRPAVSSSRCPVVPSSRRPVVPSSPRPAVPRSRSLVVLWSCWRASQSFPAVPSLSQSFSVFPSQSRASQSFPVNRAPPSLPQSIARLSAIPNRVRHLCLPISITSQLSKKNDVSSAIAENTSLYPLLRTMRGIARHPKPRSARCTTRPRQSSLMRT